MKKEILEALVETWEKAATAVENRPTDAEDSTRVAENYAEADVLRRCAGDLKHLLHIFEK